MIWLARPAEFRKYRPPLGFLTGVKEIKTLTLNIICRSGQLSMDVPLPGGVGCAYRSKKTKVRTLSPVADDCQLIITPRHLP